MVGHTELYTLDNLLSDYRGRFTRFARLYMGDEAMAEDFVTEDQPRG